MSGQSAQTVVEQNDGALRNFYETFKEPMSLPDFDLFRRTLSDPNKRRKFYDTFREPASLPDYDKFQRKLGFSDDQPEQPGNNSSQTTAPKPEAPAPAPKPEAPAPAPKNKELDAFLTNFTENQQARNTAGMPTKTGPDAIQKNLDKINYPKPKDPETEKYGRTMVADMKFQKGAITSQEADAASLKSYFDSQKEKFSMAAKDMEMWQSHAVMQASEVAQEKANQDPEFRKVMEGISNQVNDFSAKRIEEIKTELAGRPVTSSEAARMNAGVQQEAQAMYEKLVKDNPQLQEIYQRYADEQSELLKTEYESRQRELVRPNTKLIPQPFIDLGDKLVSSEAFDGLGYDEKKYALANQWKRISRQLSKDGVPAGKILDMRDEWYYALMPKVLYDESSHMTSFGIRSWAEEMSQNIDQQLADLKKRISDEKSQKELSGQFMGSGQEGDNTAGQITRQGDKLRDQYRNLVLAKENIEQLQQMPDKDMGTFFDGFLQDGIRNKLPFISSWMDIMDLNRMLKTAEKVKNNEPLNEPEQLLMNSYAARENIESLSKPSMWYNAGKATAQSIPYMLEFVATGAVFDGTYAAAKAGITASLKKAIGSSIEKKVVQNAIIKPIAGILAIEAQTAANPQAYIKNAMERMRPNMQLAFSEEANSLIGKLDWNTKQLNGNNTGHGEDKWTAFTKGFLLASGEMGSERAGELLEKTFKWVGSKPGVQKLVNPDLMKRLTLGYYMEKYGLSLSDAKKQILNHGMSWNGFPNEMIEEIVNIPFSNLVTGDQSMFTGITKEDGSGIDWENLGTIAISIGATTGVMTAAQFAMAKRTKPVTVHYRDVNGIMAPIKINGDTFRKVFEATHTLSADELDKWKAEQLPKLKMEGEQRAWANSYVDGWISKKKSTAGPNAAPTTNTETDEILMEAEEVAQEEANEIVRENPEILNNQAETPQTTNEDEKGSENAQETGGQAGGQKDAEENGQEKSLLTGDQGERGGNSDSPTTLEDLNSKEDQLTGQINQRRKDLIKLGQPVAGDQVLQDMTDELDQVKAEKEKLIQESGKTSTDTAQQLRPLSELQPELDDLYAKRDEYIRIGKNKYDPEAWTALNNQIADWEKSVKKLGGKVQTIAEIPVENTTQSEVESKLLDIGLTDEMISLQNLIDEYPDDKPDLNRLGDYLAFINQISKSYDEAKKSGENPELVNAVDDLLAKKQNIASEESKQVKYEAEQYGFSILPKEVADNLPAHKSGKVIQGEDFRLSEIPGGLEDGDMVVNSYNGKVFTVKSTGEKDKSGYPMFELTDSEGNVEVDSERPIYQYVENKNINTENEVETTDAGTDQEQSEQDVIQQQEAAISQAELARTDEEIREALDAVEKALTASEKKIKGLKDKYETDGIPHETPSVVVGKEVKKEIRKFIGVVAKYTGWTIDKVYNNIPPAGGDAVFELSIPGTPLIMYGYIKYEPEYNQSYDNYKPVEIFYRVEDPTLKGTKTFIGPNRKYVFKGGAAPSWLGIAGDKSPSEFSPRDLAEILIDEARPYINKYQSTSPEQKIQDIVDKSGIPKDKVIVSPSPSNQKPAPAAPKEQTPEEKAKAARDTAVGLLTGKIVDRIEEAGFIFTQGNLEKNGFLYNELSGIATGSRAERLIGSGITVAPAAPKQAPKEQPSRTQQAKDELDDLLGEFDDAIKKSRGNLTVGGIDPEVLRTGAKVIAKYIELGTYKLSDILKDVVSRYAKAGKQFTEDLLKGYQTVYLAYQSDVDDATLDQMESVKDVRSIKIEDLTTNNTNTDEKPNNQEGADNTGQPGSSGNANNKGNARTRTGGTKQTSDKGSNKPSSGTGQDLSNQEGGANQGENGSGTSDRSGNTGDTIINEGLKTDSSIQNNFLYPAEQSQQQRKSFSKSLAYDQNIAALEVIVDLLENPGTFATDKQKEILSKYNGLGPLVELLNNEDKNHPDWTKTALQFYDQAIQLRGLLKKIGDITKKNTIDSAKNSTRNAFYTSIPVIRSIWDGVRASGFSGGRILEGSMGSGRFIGAMPADLMHKSKIRGIDKDVVSALISKYLYPKASVTNSALESASIPSNTFDLFISNIPFGKSKVYDPIIDKKGPDWQESQSKLHSYFTAKAIDSVRPGGYVVIISTHALLDSPSNSGIRDLVERETDFVGAVRLPASTFNSDAGTQVTTDVILLRKKQTPSSPSNSQISELFSETVPHNDSKYPDQEITYNAYFKINPQNVLGDFMAGGLYSATSGLTVKGEIDNDKLSSLLSDMAKAMPIQEREVSEGDAQKTLQIGPMGRMVAGGIVEKDGEFYRVESYDTEKGKFNIEKIKDTVLPSKKDLPILSNYIKARDKYFEVLTKDRQRVDAKKERRELRKIVEDLINASKPMMLANLANGNKTINRLLLSDPDFFSISSLQKPNGTLADIVNEPLKTGRSKLEKTDNPDDAIAYSINQIGRVDIDYIKTVLSKNSIEETIDALGDRVFETIDGELLERQEYLSGNVLSKLEQAKEWAKIDSKYEKNVAELEKVQPKKIDTEDIRFQLGANWIPYKVYQDFFNSIFGEGNIKITYQKALDEYHVEMASGFSNSEYEAVGEDVFGNGQPETRGVDVVIKAALTKNVPNFTKKISEDRTVGLPLLSQDVRDKAERLQDEFASFILTDLVSGESLTKIYNSLFNNTVNRTFDGKNLTFEGMQFYKLDPHQLDAVMMILQRKGGIVDHIVGAGKSLVMIAACMKLKQLNLVNKPVITTLKSVVPGLYEQAKKAFPMAKILAPSEKDFEAKNRQKLFAQIANNDWDIIIMTHENLGTIPLPAEFETKYIEDEVSNLREALTEITALANEEKRGGPSTRQKKAIEDAIDNLVSRLARLQDKGKSASRTDFGSMGVDMLFVDESQQFKNLNYITKLRNVAGLGTPKGSSRASNLKMVSRYLQNMNGGEKGVVFASGTPISNSLVELYNIFQYIRPELLKTLGISSLDQFIKNFAVVSAEFEKGVTNIPKQKARLRKFVNVSELASFYTEVSDIRGEHNLKIEKPNIKNGKMELVIVPQSETISNVTSAIIESAINNSLDPLISAGVPVSANADKAMTLYLTGINAKVALDPRLIFPSSGPDGGKLFVAADKLTEIYNQTSDNKGVQLVFSDLGVPKNKTARLGQRVRDAIIEKQGEEWLSEYSGAESVFALKTEDEIIEKMMETFEMQYEEAREIVDEANNTETFNVYQGLKDLLIRRGIPEETIAFIHDYPTKKQKNELFEKVNNGDIRILLGSTMKMGTGVNVQTRIAAMHHLDIPWRPSDMEQRNGRGIRRGNMYSEVAIYAYGTENTLDQYKFGLLSTKQRGIDGFRAGAKGVREMEFEDGESMTLAEFQAALSGDSRILDLDKLKNQIRKLEIKVGSATRANILNKSRLESAKASLDFYRENTRSRVSDSYEKLMTGTSAEMVEEEYKEKDKEDGTPGKTKKTNVLTYYFNGRVNGRNFDTSNKIERDMFYEQVSKEISGIRSRDITIGDINGVPLIVSYSNETKNYTINLGPFEVLGSGLSISPGWIKTYITAVFNSKAEKLLSYTKDLYNDALIKYNKQKEVPEVNAKQEDIDKLMELTKKRDELILELRSEDDSEENEEFDITQYDENGNIIQRIGGSNPGTGRSENRMEGGLLPPNEQKSSIDNLVSFLNTLKIGGNGQVYAFDPITAFGVATWNSAITILQTSLKAGKVIADAINDAVIALRPHLASAGVHEADVRDFFTNALKNPGNFMTPQQVSDLRNSVRSGLTGKAANIHNTIFVYDAPSNPNTGTANPVNAVLGTVARGQQSTFGKATIAAGDSIAKLVSRGLQSRNLIVRKLTRIASHIIQNLERDTEWVRRAEKFFGEYESRAMLNAAELSNELKNLLKAEAPDTLKRIDEVLDPEFYSRYGFDEFMQEWENLWGAPTSMSKKDQMALYDEYLKFGIGGLNRTPLTYDDLTDREKYVHDIIKSTYEYIHDVNFAIGRLSVDTYLLNRNKYHARMYEPYEIPAEIEQTFNEAVKYMQLGMYERRTDLDMWKMGNKIEDPVHSVSKRLMQTMMNKAIYDYSNWIKIHRPQFVSKSQKPGFVKMNGKGWGPLQGSWVMKDIAEDFQGFHFSNAMVQKLYDVIRYLPLIGTMWKPEQWYLKPLSQDFWKKLFTVYMPPVHIGNFMGNVMFGFMMGINPVRYAGNFVQARKEIKNKTPLYHFMVNEGMIGSDISWEDLQNNISQIEMLIGKKGFPKWQDYKEKPFDSLSKMAEYTYHMNDELGKIAAMKSLMQMGFTYNESAEKVKQGMQNRHRTGPLYKVFSKVPIIGPPFGAFAGDLIRIVTSGTTRTPLTVGVYIAALHGMAALASAGGGEDDKKRAIRENRPGFTSIQLPQWINQDWAKYVPILNFFTGPVPLSFKFKSNQELNLARFISPLYIYQSPTDDDFYNMIQRLSPMPVEKEQEWTSNPEGVRAVWMSKMARDPRFAPLIQLWNNSDFRGVPIIDREETIYRRSTMTDAEKKAAAAHFLARNYIPYATLVDDIRLVNESERDYYDRKRTVSQIVLRYLLGWNAQVYDDQRYKETAEKAIKSQVSKFVANERLLNALDNEYIKSRKKGENPMSDETFRKRQAELYVEQAEITQEVKQELIRIRGVLLQSEMKKAMKEVRMSKAARSKLLKSTFGSTN